MSFMTTDYPAARCLHPYGVRAAGRYVATRTPVVLVTLSTRSSEVDEIPSPNMRLTDYRMNGSPAKAKASEIRCTWLSIIAIELISAWE